VQRLYADQPYKITIKTIVITSNTHHNEEAMISSFFLFAIDYLFKLTPLYDTSLRCSLNVRLMSSFLGRLDLLFRASKRPFSMIEDYSEMPCGWGYAAILKIICRNICAAGIKAISLRSLNVRLMSIPISCYFSLHNSSFQILGYVRIRAGMLEISQE
jgi:hypothetical protein